MRELRWRPPNRWMPSCGCHHAFGWRISGFARSRALLAICRGIDPTVVAAGYTQAVRQSNGYINRVKAMLLQGTGYDESLVSEHAHKGLVVGDVVDIFVDGSAFAISVPGHTPGSTAYVLRATKGPILLTGETCHTRWG